MDPDSTVETLVDELVDESVESETQSSGMKQVITLAISLSILQIGFGIITPIFPFYIVELHVGGFELGILAASFAITRIALAGPFGQLSDRIGRKPVFVYGLLGYAVANVVYAWAGNIFIMIGARAVEGAVSAGFFPAANAYVSDVTTPENRGTAMGYLSMGNMVGFIIGPTLGGILAQFLGIRMPFIIAAYATLITLCAVLYFVREPEVTIIKLEGAPKVPIREVFSTNKRNYSVLALAMFANMFALGILEVAFMLDAVIRFSMTPMDIGLFFLVLGVVTIIGNIVFGKLSDKYGRKWLIVVGSAIGGVSLLLFMVMQNIAGFYVAGAVLGIAIAMRGPTIQALIADLTDERAYGSMMGVFGAVSNSAYVIGPLLGGMLFDMSGTGESSLAIAAVVSFAGVIAATFLPGKVPRRTRSPHADSDESQITLE